MNARTLVVAVVLSAWSAGAQVVPWAAETPPVASFILADIALLRPPGTAPLIVVGEAQMTGAQLYDLSGLRVQTLLLGGVRGIDARGGVLAVASPVSQVIASYVFDAGMVVGLAPPIPLASSNALALSRVGGALELWVDTASPTVRRYQFDDAGAQLVDSVVFPRSPNAMVVDDRTGWLFVATFEGIYVLRPGTAPELLLDLDGGQLGGEPMGEALYPLRDGGALLVTAIPSRSDFVVHSVTAASADFLGRFSVGAPDGSTALVSNGASVDVTAARAPGFDGGLLIVTDGLRANVKLVAWEAVAAAFVPPLPVEVPSDVADAGQPDAGTPDAGRADAGPDAGRDAGMDAGSVDAGQGGGAGGGGGTAAGGGGAHTGGGRTGGGAGGGEETPMGCTCAQPDFALVPLLAGLWLVRKLQRRRTRPS